MGWSGNSIGQYRIVYHQSEDERYFKKARPLEYLEKAIINAEFKNEETKSEVDIKVPLYELFDFKKLKKYYRPEHVDHKSIHRYLYKYLTEKGTPIKLYCRLPVTPYMFSDYKYQTEEVQKQFVYNYFLQTEIGDESLVFTREPKLHTITDYNQFQWLNFHCIETDWKVWDD